MEKFGRFEVCIILKLDRWILQRLQDASRAFNSFQPHDDIGALLKRTQIPVNDQGASRQRQILLPSESLTPFFFRYANLGHSCWRLGYSSQGTWNISRNHRRNNSWLVWYGSPSAPDICSLVRLAYNSRRTRKGLLEEEQGPA